MSHDQLMGVLADLRALLAQPGNDFSWSGWASEQEALAEIDQQIVDLALGRLHILFAPTGPIQEVAVSSGWPDEYLSLASRFDEAIGL